MVEHFVNKKMCRNVEICYNMIMMMIITYTNVYFIIKRNTIFFLVCRLLGPPTL